MRTWPRATARSCGVVGSGGRPASPARRGGTRHRLRPRSRRSGWLRMLRPAARWGAAAPASPRGSGRRVVLGCSAAQGHGAAGAPACSRPGRKLRWRSRLRQGQRSHVQAGRRLAEAMARTGGFVESIIHEGIRPSSAGRRPMRALRGSQMPPQMAWQPSPNARRPSRLAGRHRGSARPAPCHTGPGLGRRQLPPLPARAGPPAAA
jgi:hypothetical protein